MICQHSNWVPIDKVTVECPDCGIQAIIIPVKPVQRTRPRGWVIAAIAVITYLLLGGLPDFLR